jgi:hypothetical protein
MNNTNKVSKWALGNIDLVNEDEPALKQWEKCTDQSRAIRGDIRHGKPRKFSQQVADEVTRYCRYSRA